VRVEVRRTQVGAELERHNKTVEEVMTTRRTLIKQGALGAATLATSTAMPWRMLRAQPKPVKIAVIAPLSGPWARQGTLVKWGAETAVNEINSSGGIKSMGGAKLELVPIDAGDSAEKAKNAAQRLVAQEPDVVGGMGAWLSTFTLAVTEVTERAQIPWLTLSYADSITGRGFKYVFQSSMPAGKQPEAALPTIIELAKAATGKPPATAGIIGDNTASPVAFLKPMREGGLQKLGIKVLMDETFTPPLSDATPLMQKVRSTRPEFLVYVTTTISDVKLGLEKLNEFRLGKGAIPIIANGAHMGAPEVLKNVPADLIEGLMFIVANWPMKGHEEIEALFKKQSGEPWITQDGLAGYGHTWILKEGLERAGVADRVKVNDEIHKLDLTTGRAADTFPGGVKFDEAGRRTAAPVCIAQWQDGKPLTVFPTERAVAKARWPKSA
jgi:branched-chain amino acid transport system substrate-binding protein